MAYLELRGVSKSFGSVTAVKGFSLEIQKGSLVSFLGPSGCGKTTTLRMIAGFETPDEDGGAVLLDGEDITRLPPNRRDIGMVFQSYALFPNMSVRGNVAFGLRMHRLSRQDADRRVAEMLELVRLEETAHRYPHQLSGGQQQRIALARALAIRPRVLLLDEPLSALDAEVRVALRGEVRRIQSELGITTVYVTHDQEEALSISDRVVVMNRGLMEQVGTPEEIYHEPRTRFVAGFIGTANQLMGETGDAGEVRTLGTHLRAPAAAGMGRAARVVVLVRPESMEIHSAAPAGGGRNVLEGIVETITFHGAITRVGVEVRGQRLSADMTASSGGRTRISLNQRVWLSFPPEACQVMPAGD
jgi:putative spermidine/putrescine transport system ATP-binding protein